MIATLSSDDKAALDFPELASAAPEKIHSIWHSRIAWVLLLPLVFFAAGGYPLSQNNPDVFLSGSDSILTAPSYEPFGRYLQSIVWILMAGVFATYLKSTGASLVRFRFIGLLMAYIFVSGFWADNVLDSLRRGLLCNLTLLLAFYLSSRFTQLEQLQLFFGVGVFGVIGSYLTAVLLPSINAGFGNGWQGMFGNKNDLGIFLFFLLSTAFFLPAGRRSLRLFRGCILGLGLVLVALSQSRGGWLVTAVCCIYAVVSRFLHRFERRNALLLVITAVPFLLGLAILINVNLDSLAYALGKDPSLSNRTLIWGAVWPSILKRFFLGYGYGGFWNGLEGESGNVILRVGTSLSHAHNGLLNIWLELGLVGVVLALGITALGIERLFVCLGAARQPYFLWYGVILLMIIVGSLDESFFLSQNVLTTTLWALACIELEKTASGVRNAPVTSPHLG